MARARSTPKMLVEELTPKEAKMLFDAVNAYQDVVEEAVREYGERPQEDLEVFESVFRKVSKLVDR